jgi:hypothetical protein
MVPHLMNHYLRKYLIKIWCVLYHRRDHTCFQQNQYVFDVIVTSWALFVFCISWNFARDISTVFEEIKHLRSRAPEKYFTRLLKSYIVYNCYVPTYHRFYGKDCFSNIKTSSKRLEYLNIFPSLSKKFSTSWNQKNTLAVFVFYLF